MRTLSLVRFGTVLLSLVSLAFSAPSHAQTSTTVSIKWEVKSRFRLFKNEDDFKYMADNHGRNGVLADETALSRATNGNGWARRMVSQLCLDDDGQLLDSCSRDYSGHDASDRESIREDYLTPAEHRIGVKADGALPAAVCTWKFLPDGNDAKASVIRDKPCTEEVFVRAAYGKTTQVQLFVTTHPEDGPPTATSDVKVRDLLLVGLGDSTAAGEGNPDRPVGLADNGFCFGRFFSGGDAGAYYRPNRAAYRGNRSCADPNNPDDTTNWAKARAHWMNGECHRSLYSYQLRVALALAIENPQIAVTFIPLACTGATIKSGILDRQIARERYCDFRPGRPPCSRWVSGQMDTLNNILGKAHQRDKDRNPDLLLLSIGANDIDFSGLVANVMIDHKTKEFGIFKKAGLVSDVTTAALKLKVTLPGDFADLRTALKRLLGNKLERVVFVSYGHPALYDDGKSCPASRQGFDVHPAFIIDGDLLEATSEFVKTKFFPRLKAFATCGQDGGCRSPDQDRMTFVDDHQAQFESHGFCAQADDDPSFDRECFKDGGSFKTDPNAAQADPMTCRRAASSFRAYLSRQRWIRTANDSYFAAMTYPTELPVTPPDIHDPIWGATSAVYGGAMHPTAQGYAAIADAALPAARRLLGLPTPQ
jgi:hypothetical protein